MMLQKQGDILMLRRDCCILPIKISGYAPVLGKWVLIFLARKSHQSRTLSRTPHSVERWVFFRQFARQLLVV